MQVTDPVCNVPIDSAKAAASETVLLFLLGVLLQAVSGTPGPPR